MVLGQNVILEKVATGPRGWLLGLSRGVYYICREFGVVEVVEGEEGREGEIERRREGGRESGRAGGGREGEKEMMLTRERRERGKEVA